MPPVVLTIAGSDPSGGAGIQADLKTIHRHGGYGASVLTVLTMQNTQGVTRAEAVPHDVVRDQLRSVLTDLAPAAVKTGALGSAAVVREVGEVARRSEVPWVVDPVSLPSRGVPLGDGLLAEALAAELLPHATLVTPNAREAAELAGFPVETLADANRAAEQIAALGCRSVLVTGGHFAGDTRGTDLLWDTGRAFELPPSQVLAGEFHGTGCALSAAIATRLARGEPLPEAVKRSKAWLESALATAFPVGAGAKPVNHLAPLDPDA